MESKEGPDWLFPIFLAMAGGVLMGGSVSVIKHLGFWAGVLFCFGVFFFSCSISLLHWELGHWEFKIKKKGVRK